MTRSEKWHATYRILQNYEVRHNGDRLEELTEYLHQVGLGGEKETYMDILKWFHVETDVGELEDIENELEEVYAQED